MFSKSTSPLYIVSKDGQEIQELFSWIRDHWEKQGMEPILTILKTLLDVLKAQIQSYALLDVFEDLLNKFVALLKELVGMFPREK